jgi:hypothetical protein
MLVTDGNGLPIGLELASANHHEVKLAVPALQTVWVPRRGGGSPKQRPRELVAERLTTANASGSGCVQRGSSRRSHYSSGVRGSTPSSGDRESPTKLRGALEGGMDLRLAGKRPAALGAPRAPPFDLPGLFTGRSHPRVSEATLTCPKELRER